MHPCFERLDQQPPDQDLARVVDEQRKGDEAHVRLAAVQHRDQGEPEGDRLGGTTPV